MESDFFSIIECIVFEPDPAICIELMQCNYLLLSYSDHEHSHFLLNGSWRLPRGLNHYIILSHAWRDKDWCINRLKSQSVYHNTKSVREEIADLLDYLEIPLPETCSIIDKLKMDGGKNVTARPQQSNHTLITG